MRISTTTFWKSPPLIALLLINLLALDPTVLFKRHTLFILKKKRKPLAFCTLVKHESCSELKSVYTLPRERGKGYASKVIKKALVRKKGVYVVCKSSLVSFYTTKGFRPVKQAPFALRWRKRFYDTFLAIIFGEQLAILRN